jgi:agmatinase
MRPQVLACPTQVLAGVCFEIQSLDISPMPHNNTNPTPLSPDNFWPPRNFGALDAEWSGWEDSRFVVLPVPYDATTTWRGGTREGPAAIIDASMNMELFDRELGREIAASGIFTSDEVEPDARGPEFMAQRVRDVTAQVLAAGKIPIMLGGEHSLSLGAIQAVASTCDGELTVLQLDAHTDLRHEYGNSPFSHGSVMRRSGEIENVRIVQVGLRSSSREECEDVPPNVTQMWAEDIVPRLEDRRERAQVLEEINVALGPNLYITFDVDACDPSWMPDTGTPEPGGLGFYAVRDILKTACSGRQVLGADCVELIGGHPASAFAVARLLYKMMGYMAS